MTDTNLSSHQNGWYNPGDKLTLMCSKHGQPVRGYFSFDEPNGGWNDLWYKTSDGDFVAGVDIKTGALKPVSADCGEGASAPAYADGRAAQALAWARDQMATDPNRQEGGNPVPCEVFVEEAYNHAFRYPSAMAAFNDLRAKGEIQTNADRIPVGAIVFTSNPAFDQGNGHVMLSQGDGTYLTANYVTAPHIRVVIVSPPNQFLGWAYAPSTRGSARA